MIIADNESNVTMFGQMEVVEFEIKTDDAKMFHILSNLYSDPLGAVVREISTNCCDGHKIKGNVETPFDIILPGSMDMGNFISFRDYGPGMSHQNIKDIYTKFGQSTKVNSNDQTGCLGLGSKSPLAITSSFTVTSVCDGIKTVYSISKDNQGKPNLSVFGTSESSEENGLMVTVPLTGQYVDKVIPSIKEELKYFKVKPRIMKGPEEDTTFKWENQFGNFFELIPDVFYINKRENNTQSTIIQGEIGYAFSSETLMKMISIDETLEDDIISDKMQVNEKTFNILKKFYAEFSIKLFSDMGTISFAPNREELIYDTFTSKNLIRSTIKAINYIYDIYANAYSYVRNPFEFESLSSYSTSLKTDNELYKKYISRFGFKFSKAYGIENFTLLDGSAPFADGVRAIKYYDCFSKIEQVTHMQKKGYEDGFAIKKHVKTERGYREDYRSCISLKDICGSNQDHMHIVFISGEKEYKFAKKHLANYYSFFNDRDIQMIIVELKYMSQIAIDEFIQQSGLSKGFAIPFSDVLSISNYQTEQEKLLGTVKEVVKAPSKQVILRKAVLENLPSKIEYFNKFTTTTTDIREELTGIYISTHNNAIVFSDRVKNEYPELFELYSINDTKSIIDVFKALNEIGGIVGSKMKTDVYVGNEKYFNKSGLIHFEDFILQHIKAVQLLNNLATGPKILNIVSSMSSENKKIMDTFNIYDLTLIEPTERETIGIREALKTTMAPLSEWFYDKDTRFLQAFNIWKMYAKDKIISQIFINAGVVGYGEKYISKIEEIFNIKIIVHKIDNILSFSFKEQYNYRFNDIRRYSDVRNSYMSISDELNMLQNILEDINTVDYIRMNVKGIRNISILPIHSCEEPSPPTQEELAEIARLKELEIFRKEEEMKNLYLEEKFNFEYIEDTNSQALVAE